MIKLNVFFFSVENSKIKNKNTKKKIHDVDIAVLIVIVYYEIKGIIYIITNQHDPNKNENCFMTFSSIYFAEKNIYFILLYFLYSYCKVKLNFWSHIEIIIITKFVCLLQWWWIFFFLSFFNRIMSKVSTRPYWQ